jgi:hypothetical protein
MTGAPDHPFLKKNEKEWCAGSDGEQIEFELRARLTGRASAQRGETKTSKANYIGGFTQ